MNHPTSSSAPATTRVGPPAVPFAPPCHVKRWTGRSALTIPLPNLATLRLSPAPDIPRGAPSLMRA